jgi:signal peptidase I
MAYMTSTGWRAAALCGRDDTMSDESQSGKGQAETPIPALEKIKRETIEFVRFILGAAVVFMIITTVGFRTFYIPSGSMEPTLEVGDRVIVLNFVYGWSRHSLQFGLGAGLPEGDGRILGRLPGRGDVIVFRHPERREHLIKRVIGLPGDRIQMREGRLFINGEIVPRDLRGAVSYRNYSGVRVNDINRYEETLPGGVTHAIYEETDQGFADDTPEITVPDGHVFVMGDNRDNSQDSRSPLGAVPAEFIVGRAVTVLFTLHSCDREEGLSCPRMWDRVWRGL